MPEKEISGEDAQGQPSGPLIIGVGASAGAPDSIERFLSNLKLESDQVLVLALRHREALDEGRLRESLRRFYGVKLVEVTDGMPIDGQAIYLCPANMIAAIQGGKFALRPAQQLPGERATIDSFLVSLAEERGEHAIGVILQGTGGDGTLGAATL